MGIAGGAIAIKGFNYQKAVICLVAVLNYHKEGFEIFVENQEDAEVITKDNHTFIQIKGSKLSIKNLKKNDAAGKSILGKNLSKNAAGARYKIITLDSFADKDRKGLIDSDENLIFDKIHKYSDDQKRDIIAELKNQGFEEEDLKNKLAVSYLYFSPFKNNYSDALTFIKGKMSECNIKVDDKRGDNAIRELVTQIDQRSEILPTQANPYNPRKKLTTYDLAPILITASHDFQKRVLDDVAQKITLIDRVKIEQHLLKILSSDKALKRRMMKEIGDFTMEDKDTFFLIEELREKVKDLETDRYLVDALLIDIIADKLLEVTLCS